MLNLFKRYLSSNRFMVQLVLLGILIIILQIPIGSIESLIYERQLTKDFAVQEVSKLAGGAQQIMGPVLIIPYTRRITDGAGTRVVDTGKVAIAPDTLTIESDAAITERYRGLFSIPTYQTSLVMKGSFLTSKFPQQPKTDQPEEIASSNDGSFTIQKVDRKDEIRDEFHYKDALLTLGVSDPKNILDASPLVWDETPVAFQAGTASFMESGIHAKLQLKTPSDKEKNEKIHFSFRLVVSGSGAISLSP